MYKQIKKHITSDKGEGYVMFLIFITVFILLMSIIFTILTIRITTGEIYNEVENSVDSVISTMKVDSYQALINGDTLNSQLPSNASNNERNRYILQQIARMLDDKTTNSQGNPCNVLELSATEAYYEHYNYSGQLVYRIDGIDSRYEHETGQIEITFNLLMPVRITGLPEPINITHRLTKHTSFNFKDNNE